MQSAKIRCLIAGASGYTGYELYQHLLKHPAADIVGLIANQNAGKKLSDIFPTQSDHKLISVEESPDCDVVFICMHSGAETRTLVEHFLDKKCRVIDLGGDYRLKDPNEQQKYYEHDSFSIDSHYGLCTFRTEAKKDTQFIANPGCYPTSIILPLLPLKDHLGKETIIIDSKSGTTGAGRKPTPHLLFSEQSENFSAYALGNEHRHLPEIIQNFKEYLNHEARVIFTPHLLPIKRGILSSIYIPITCPLSKCIDLALEYYHDDPLISYTYKSPTISHVANTHRCLFTYHKAGDYLQVISVIDNLLKGAATQAIQNMNIMFGFPAYEGLI